MKRIESAGDLLLEADDLLPRLVQRKLVVHIASLKYCNLLLENITFHRF